MLRAALTSACSAKPHDVQREGGLVRAGCVLSMCPHARAQLRGVGRVDVHERHPGTGRLVGDEPAELVERPRVQRDPLGPAEPYPVADAPSGLPGRCRGRCVRPRSRCSWRCGGWCRRRTALPSGTVCFSSRLADFVPIRLQLGAQPPVAVPDPVQTTPAVAACRRSRWRGWRCPGPPRGTRPARRPARRAARRWRYRNHMPSRYTRSDSPCRCATSMACWVGGAAEPDAAQPARGGPDRHGAGVELPGQAAVVEGLRRVAAEPDRLALGPLARASPPGRGSRPGCWPAASRRRRRPCGRRGSPVAPRGPSPSARRRWPAATPAWRRRAARTRPRTRRSRPGCTGPGCPAAPPPGWRPGTTEPAQRSSQRYSGMWVCHPVGRRTRTSPGPKRRLPPARASGRRHQVPARRPRRCHCSPAANGSCSTSLIRNGLADGTRSSQP